VIRRWLPLLLLAPVALAAGADDSARVAGYLSPVPSRAPRKLVFRVPQADGSVLEYFYQGRFARSRDNRVITFAGPATVRVIPAPKPPPAPPEEPESSEAAAALLAAANRARQAAGLSALQDEPRLDRAAQGWAEFCARAGTLSHFGPAGTTDADPWTRLRAAGFPATYDSANENAAAWQTTYQQVINDWLDSPGHRANLLNPKWNYAGGGAATAADGRKYYIQDYAAE
jgi:uncharacterized protein YkwD